MCRGKLATPYACSMYTRRYEMHARHRAEVERNRRIKPGCDVEHARAYAYAHKFHHAVACVVKVCLIRNITKYQLAKLNCPVPRWVYISEWPRHGPWVMRTPLVCLAVLHLPVPSSWRLPHHSELRSQRAMLPVIASRASVACACADHIKQAHVFVPPF